MTPATSSTIAYVGTYTGGKSQGIYAFQVDELTKGDPTFTSLGLAAATPNPTFLALDSGRHLLFAVNETGIFAGQPTGSVSAYSAHPTTGKLALINQQPSLGTDPCHAVLDPTGRFLLIANYSSGSVAVLPVAADGHLGTPSAAIQHQGKSVDPKRQEGPHAHGVTFDPAGRYVFICDLGLDRLVAYQFNQATGALVAAPSAGGTVKPGSGPRHLVFSPSGRFAYVLNEMAATVTTFDYDAATGRLAEQQTLSTLPVGYSGQKWCAELAVHPSGRWLYASNRGHNSLTQFMIDATTGLLKSETTQDTGGRTPRHFVILASGKHLVIANQESDTLRLCRIDEATGRLQPVGEMIPVAAPVCVAFLIPARN